MVRAAAADRQNPFKSFKQFKPFKMWADEDQNRRIDGNGANKAKFAKEFSEGMKDTKVGIISSFLDFVLVAFVVETGICFFYASCRRSFFPMV